MNSKINSIIILFFLAALYSCGEDTKEATLTVSTQEIVLGIYGMDNKDAPAVFGISSSVDWTLKCSEWLTPSITSGGSGDAEVSVAASETSEERTGYVTVENQDARAIIKVRQLAEELITTILTVSPTSVTVDFDGSTPDGNRPALKVSAYRPWTISGLPDWITASPASGNAGTDMSVNLMVGTNEMAIVREADFQITSGVLSSAVAVTQLVENQQLTVLPSSIEVEADGKTSDGDQPTFTISTNKDWTIVNLPAWITATPASGSAGTDITVTLTVGSNDLAPRTATININAGFLSESIDIHQLEAGSVEEYFPFIVGVGGIAGNSEVIVNDRDSYWEIATNCWPGSEYPWFSNTLSTNISTGAGYEYSLEFEYQVPVDLPNVMLVFIKGDMGAIATRDLPQLDATSGIDPSDEAVWKHFSYNLKQIVDWGWGVENFTQIRFDTRKCETMLIRNFRIVVKMPE